MIVERTDFVSVPVTDLERSTVFYRDTLGLPQVGHGAWPEYQLGENVSLYLIDPTNIGQAFAAPHTSRIALRVADVAAARAELEAARRRVRRRDVRHRRLSHGRLPRSRRERADAAPPLRTAGGRRIVMPGPSCFSVIRGSRCRRSPTSTGASLDLAGFDPDSFTEAGDAHAAVPSTMLEIDASGVASVGEAGITIDHAPEGIRFELLTDDHPLLGSLVGHTEKFAAHNAAMWEHGLLVHVPKGVVLEKPIYIRIANAVEGGSLFWRLLIVAEAQSRFTVIEEYASASPELSGYSNAAVEIIVEDGAKVEYVSVQNYSQSTWHFGSHHATVGRDAELDWVAGGFGSGGGKVWIQNDLAGQGATSRVTGAYFADHEQRLDYDTFQEHIAPNTTSDFAFKGVLRDSRERGLARHDSGREGRPEDERVPGKP